MTHRPIVSFTQVSDRARVPQYQTAGAAGADLHAHLDQEISIPAGGVKIVGTGIRIALPSDFEAQVRSRSGLAAKNHVFVLNSPGTIDADYRGEIMVILCNASQVPFRIQHGDRIAQLVVAPVVQARFEYNPNLEETERGSGGLGSTGIASAVVP
jgi:dUTP pyrophosphatase